MSFIDYQGVLKNLDMRTLHYVYKIRALQFAPLRGIKEEQSEVKRRMKSKYFRVIQSPVSILLNSF